MGKKLLAIFSLLIISLLLSASGQGENKSENPPEKKITVAVYPIKVLAPDKSFESYGPILTSFLVTKLSKSTKLKVIEQEMTAEVEKQLEFANSDKCDATTCPVPEIGKAMAAQKLVVGQVAKLGQKYTANVRVIDIEKKIIDFSVEEPLVCKEEDLDQLMELVALDLREKFGEKVEMRPAYAQTQPIFQAQPGSSNPQVNADAYFKSGEVNAHNKQWDQAIEDYSKAIELEPKKAVYYVARGLVYMGKEQRDQAISDYSKAIELNPKSGAVYYFRGLAYKANGQPDLAKKDFDKAVKLDPKLEKQVEKLN